MVKVRWMLCIVALSLCSGLGVLTVQAQSESVPPFEERFRVELVYDQEAKTLSFNDIGTNKLELITETDPTTGKMKMKGFYQGTLIIVGKGGFRRDAGSTQGENYQIILADDINEGTEIQIRHDGELTDNLQFIQNGSITRTYMVMNSSNGNMTNVGTANFLFKDGKVKVEVSPVVGKNVITLSDGQCLDLAVLKVEKKACGEKAK